jgi:hypothetical protein
MRQLPYDTNGRDATLTELAYELLDAHFDTAELARQARLADTHGWRAHLDYLRDLQRVGHALLARATADQAPHGPDLRRGRTG